MYRNFLYRIYDILCTFRGIKSVYSILDDTKKLEKKSVNEIKEFYNRKLNNILEYSIKNINYYKENFPHEKLSSIDNMQKYPILTKDIIRKNFPNNLINQKITSQSHYNTTSGSTGQPLEFYNDITANPYRSSSFMLFNTWMDVGDRAVHWNLKSTGRSSIKQKLIYWLNGKNLYSVMDLKKNNVPDIISQLEIIKPMYIEGYTASLVKLAQYLDDISYQPRFPPKAIIATSETLTESNQLLLERVFSSKVFNRYGSREFSGAVAQDCSLGEGLHINPMLTFVEIVDDDGNQVSEGESGRVLITDLNNHVMPFIRYDIGDIAVKGPEIGECGRPFPIIKSINGRAGEFLIDKYGDSIPFINISAYFFRRLFAPYVYFYQFIQFRNGVVTLKIVPNDKFTQIIKSEIENALNDYMPNFDTSLDIVDEIPSDVNGKTPLLKFI